jgi:preprotein translocase subunit SecY
MRRSTTLTISALALAGVTIVAELFGDGKNSGFMLVGVVLLICASEIVRAIEKLTDAMFADEADAVLLPRKDATP